MATYLLNINKSLHEVEAEPDTPLLWILRDNLGLTGAKFGCGQGLCGSCTVLANGAPVRSCVLPVSGVGDNEILTIEGVGVDELHPVQVAWMEEDVPQCGFCQTGQIMSAIGLLEQNSDPSDSDIDDAMSGNICRCGTYGRIRKAIKKATNSI